MKHLIFLLLIVFAYSCSNNCQELKLEGKVTLEGGTGNIPIEIRIYEYGFRQFDSTMLAMTNANEQGEFELDIPEGNRFNLHVSAPGYSNIITDFERLEIEEDDIKSKIYLRKLRIPKFDQVKVIGDFNDWIWESALPMTKLEDGSWTVDVDFDKEEMGYQFLIGNTGRSLTFFKPGSEFVYDNGGDYKEILKSKDGKYQVTLKEGDFARRDTIERPDSKLTYSEPQKYADHQFLLNNFGTQDMQQLTMNYQFLVLRRNDDYIAHLTPEQIDRGARITQKSFENKKHMIDSLLDVTEDQQLLNYILCTKYEMLSVEKEKDFEEAISIIDRISDIPAAFGTMSPSFLYWKEIKEEPHKYLGKIKGIVANISDDERRAWNELYYYTTIRDYIDTNGRFENMVIKGLNDLKKRKGLDEQLYKTIDKEIATIQLAKMDLAPDFDFVDFDGEQHKLSDFRGKWVFLDFWAVWCGPCRMEIPHIVDAYNKLPKDKIMFLSVSHDGDVETPLKYNESNGMVWMQTINLPEYCKDASIRYGVNGIPSPFLIDPDGRLIKIAATDLRGNELIKTLNKYVLGIKS